MRRVRVQSMIYERCEKCGMLIDTFRFPEPMGPVTLHIKMRGRTLLDAVKTCEEASKWDFSKPSS